MKGILGKSAVVTGGARGIGKGISIRLADEGAKLIIVDIDEDAARCTAEELCRRGVQAEAYKADLRNITEIDAMVDYVYNKYNSIDILINNAGIQIREWATDFDEEKFDFLMDLNLKAYYFASRAAAKYMKTQEHGGAIVCISSANSKCYTSKRSPYNISKAAVNGLVGTLAVEWGRFNIRINAVAPGYVLTDMVQKGINDGIIDMQANFKVIPMKRLLRTDEIAGGVCFLASDEASGITGQTLFIDGGWSNCGLPED
ncbi:MAG: 2-dehydro-3-deoxy-D-gluconate 5-dehydrogenase [Firmicutes bacterium ADurb.Bin182]|nr:MAG: 2-dehydro-3-deoxy-D-gluconate 5-dehydrogenase [Firmicutes bacterium ADurb.Bin182]